MPVVSHAEPVNPPGQPPLTREQVWRGLVLKAEDPARFVPAITAGRVLERFEGGLVREATHAGHTLRERVLFDPPREVAFERLDGPGRVLNTLSDGPDGLVLTFTFEVADAEADGVRSEAPEAVRSTLRATRELLAGGGS